MGKQWKQCQILFFGVSKSLQMVIAAMKLKDTDSLEKKKHNLEAESFVSFSRLSDDLKKTVLKRQGWGPRIYRIFFLQQMTRWLEHQKITVNY